jgi:hypothetical protein
VFLGRLFILKTEKGKSKHCDDVMMMMMIDGAVVDTLDFGSQ